MAHRIVGVSWKTRGYLEGPMRVVVPVVVRVIYEKAPVLFSLPRAFPPTLGSKRLSLSKERAPAMSGYL